MSSNPQEEKRSFSLARIPQRLVRSFKDMRGEMKRVVWPTKKSVLHNTGVVLVFMLVASIVIGAYDWILSYVLRFSLGLGG